MVLGGLAASCVCASAAAPTVIITNLPAYGTTSNLGGVIVNASPAACSVAVFIYVPGYGWVTKPTCAQPLTPIQPDGSWSAGIITGGSDQFATRIAALLVSTNYSQPCVLGAAALPTNVFAQALASAVVTRPYPGPRWLSFSGYDWWLKTSAGAVGPGRITSRTAPIMFGWMARASAFQTSPIAPTSGNAPSWSPRGPSAMAATGSSSPPPPTTSIPTPCSACSPGATIRPMPTARSTSNAPAGQPRRPQ